MLPFRRSLLSVGRHDRQGPPVVLGLAERIEQAEIEQQSFEEGSQLKPFRIPANFIDRDSMTYASHECPVMRYGALTKTIIHVEK